MQFQAAPLQKLCPCPIPRKLTVWHINNTTLAPTTRYSHACKHNKQEKTRIERQRKAGQVPRTRGRDSSHPSIRPPTPLQWQTCPFLCEQYQNRKAQPISPSASAPPVANLNLVRTQLCHPPERARWGGGGKQTFLQDPAVCVIRRSGCGDDSLLAHSAHGPYDGRRWAREERGRRQQQPRSARADFAGPKNDLPVRLFGVVCVCAPDWRAQAAAIRCGGLVVVVAELELARFLLWFEMQ